jgi:hypothetical protein
VPGSTQGRETVRPAPLVLPDVDLERIRAALDSAAEKPSPQNDAAAAEQPGQKRAIGVKRPRGGHAGAAGRPRKDRAAAAGKTARDSAATAEKTAPDSAATAGKTAPDSAATAGKTARDSAATAGKTAPDSAATAGKTAKDPAAAAGRQASLPRRVPSTSGRQPPALRPPPALPPSLPDLSTEAPTEEFRAIPVARTGEELEQALAHPDPALSPEPAAAAPVDHAPTPPREEPAARRAGREPRGDETAESPRQVTPRRPKAPASRGKARARRPKAATRPPQRAGLAAWGRRHRRFANRALVVVALLAAGSLAFVLTQNVGAEDPAAHRGPSKAGPRNGETPSVSRAEIRNIAAHWVAAQVSRTATVSCDRMMCQALKTAGFPAALLVKLRRGNADPPHTALLVDTAAVRSMTGDRLVLADAPAVIASFGSGSMRIDVRVVAHQGGAAYLAQLKADVAARKQAGAQLLQSPAVTMSPEARSQLSAGEVDSRLIVIITGLAAQQAVTIEAFSDLGPGATRGIPMRAMALAPSAGNGMPSAAAGIRSMLVFLHAQTNYGGTQLRVVQAGGRNALSVQFMAPSPLGLFKPPAQ